MALLLVGCGSTYLKGSQSVSGQKKAYSKILVIAHFKDRLARGLNEREIAQYLEGNGIPGVASMKSEITLNFETELTQEEIAEVRRQVIQNGYDGIIVTNVIDVSEFREDIPGTFTMATMPDQYVTFGSFIGYYPAAAWTPGQVNTGTQFTLETALYTVDQEVGSNLQWVGRFEVQDPEDIRKASNQYARELTKALFQTSIRKP